MRWATAPAEAPALRWGWSALLVVCLTLAPLVLPLIDALRATAADGASGTGSPLARDGALAPLHPAPGGDGTRERPS